MILGYIINFFDSNFFVALVGFLAIYLYFKQKIDKKREAARLILQEIRYAEQQIRNSGRGTRGYALSSQLLPTNSWNDNIHLFLKKLEESEIDLISSFYSTAAYIDVLIKKISDSINTPASPIVVQQAVAASATPTQSPPSLQMPLDPMAGTKMILTQISQSIEFVYNTPAGEKLKQIANKNGINRFD